MGHSEMLLAVAGLNASEVRERTRRLAAGDWSDFPAAEATAFAFAHRLARDPAGLTDADVKGLRDVFGERRAIDLIWYAAWCNYMTRIADAFQLPLERENVFVRPPAKK